MSKKLVSAACTAVCMFATTAAMATAHVVVPASAILIQNYGGTSPTLYYTGSGCSSGHLDLDPSDSSDRQKLVWATVLSAKASGATMNFDYDILGDTCYIRAFAVQPN